MATIDFRGWRIESYTDGWVLGVPKTRLNKKREREIYLDTPSYYATLDAAVHGLTKRELRKSDAQNAAEVLDELRRLRQELAATFGAPDDA